MLDIANDDAIISIKNDNSTVLLMMALISLCLQEATTDLNHNTPTAPTQGRRKDKESKDKESHGQAQ